MNQTAHKARYAGLWAAIAAGVATTVSTYFNMGPEAQGALMVLLPSTAASVSAYVTRNLPK